MSNQLTVSRTFSASGKSFSENRTVSFDNLFSREVLVPAGRAASLTTRTDNDTGVATLSAANGGQFSTGDRLTLFWNVGGVKGSRRNMGATVAGDAITLDGGAGDVLPPAASAVVVGVQKIITGLNIDPTKVQALLVGSDGWGSFFFGDSAATPNLLWSQGMPEPVSAVEWVYGSGETIPISGANIATVRLSNAEVTAAKNMRVAIGWND
jgi:hypothetical protein